MKRIELKEVEHKFKIGQKCEPIEPNVTEDALFCIDGEVVVFYISDMSKYSDKANNLANIANKELRSDRVPKAKLNRGTKKMADAKGEEWVTQYSSILGAIPPKPHMRRPYPSISSVHREKSANLFIKAMYGLAIESELIIKKLMPKQYEEQVELFKDVDKKWRFGNLFTSSISNYNISAPYHRDAGNIIGAVNVIICKKRNSIGGDLTIPDYGATIGQQDNSMIAYPAWRNLHAVTPIVPTSKDGYRNSLVFYPLKAFVGI